jgi:hypothetical protein
VNSPAPANGRLYADRDRRDHVGEMGVRGILIYCADYRCSHSIAISGDSWPDDVRLSDRSASRFLVLIGAG